MIIGDPIVDEIIHFSFAEGWHHAECNVCNAGVTANRNVCENWAFRHYGEHVL